MTKTKLVKKSFPLYEVLLQGLLLIEPHLCCCFLCEIYSNCSPLNILLTPAEMMTENSACWYLTLFVDKSHMRRNLVDMTHQTGWISKHFNNFYPMFLLTLAWTSKKKEDNIADLAITWGKLHYWKLVIDSVKK